MSFEIENPAGGNSDEVGAGQRVLLPGYSADVEIVLAKRENVLRIPTQVILDGTRVILLEGKTLTERAIETGISSWEFTEIKAGLDEGDLVVLTVDREGVVDGAAAVVE